MFTESYERKLKGNNLILTENNLTEVNDFEENMLMQNQIKGFLNCHIYSDNNEKRFYYDITSLQSLEHLFEEKELRRIDAERIIIGIIKLKEVLEEYLLTDENVILNPKFIYVDPETKIPSFVYYPYYKKSINESLLELGTFFLKRTNHSDEEAVKLIYGFYKNISNENYAFEQLIESKHINEDDYIIPKEYREDYDKGSQEYLSNDNKDEIKFSGEIINNQENKEVQGFENLGLLVSIITLVILIVTVVLIKYMGIEKYIPLSERQLLIVCALLGAFSITAVIAILMSKIKDERIREGLYSLEKEVDIKSERIKKRNEKVGFHGKTDRLSEDIVVHKRLVSYEGGTVTEFIIDHTPFIIGKDKEVDGYLNNSSISRLHAKIFLKKNEYYITDLNSTNGTSVNSRMLAANETVKIKENDEIVLGGMVFYFR